MYSEIAREPVEIPCLRALVQLGGKIFLSHYDPSPPSPCGSVTDTPAAKTPFQAACATGRLDTVRRIADEFLPDLPDETDRSMVVQSAFHDACRSGNPELVKYLHDHGALTDWPWPTSTWLNGLGRSLKRHDIPLGATPVFVAASAKDSVPASSPASSGRRQVIPESEAQRVTTLRCVKTRAALLITRQHIKRGRPCADHSSFS